MSWFIYELKEKRVLKQCPWGTILENGAFFGAFFDQNGVPKGIVLRTIKRCLKGTILVPLTFFSVAPYQDMKDQCAVPINKDQWKSMKDCPFIFSLLIFGNGHACILILIDHHCIGIDPLCPVIMIGQGLLQKQWMQSFLGSFHVVFLRNMSIL